MLTKLVPKQINITINTLETFGTMSINLVSKPRFNMLVINSIVCYKLFREKHCLLTKE